MSGVAASPQSDLYAVDVLLRECLGERSPRLATLIDERTQQDSARRPASAVDALAILDETATGETQPLRLPLLLRRGVRASVGGLRAA